jgi:hypothetical protein
MNNFLGFLLPSEQFSIWSSFSQAEALDRLKDRMEVIDYSNRIRHYGQRKKASSAPQDLYQGSTNSESFNITRIISYRNSFLPQINGKIEQQNGGCKIDISLRLNVLVKAFMAFWFGLVLLVFIAQFFTEVPFWERVFLIAVPGFMALIGLGIVRGGFIFESRRSKKDLINLFKGELLQGRL